MVKAQMNPHMMLNGISRLLTGSVARILRIMTNSVNGGMYVVTNATVPWALR